MSKSYSMARRMDEWTSLFSQLSSVMSFDSKVTGMLQKEIFSIFAIAYLN